ncbi:MAG: SurA N-terminal domain-containing protein [Actinomycetes bacterium]
MDTAASHGPRPSLIVSLLAIAAIATGCGDSAPAAPESVPGTDTAAIGTAGATVTKAQFNRFLMAQIRGTSPIGGSIGGSIPLDPPGFARCKAALAANAAKNKQPQPAAAQLTAGCKSQYEQTRSAVQSQLISYQWLLQEAKQEGIKIDPTEVDQTLSQYVTASAGAKASATTAKAAFEQRLGKSGMTRADVQLQIKAQIAQQKLSSKEQAESEEPSTDEAKAFYKKNRGLFITSNGKKAPPFDRIEEQVKSQLKSTRLQVKQVAFQNDLQREWRAATLCAKGFVVSQCSNGPKLADLVPPKVD